MLLTHRKLLQSKAIAIENDLRGTLRNFGLKVGMVGKVRFEARIQELIHRRHSWLRSFLSLEEAGNPESAKDSVRYPGHLKFFGDHAALADAQEFAAYLAPLRRAEWVVYAKRPFGGPQAVLAYLSRYTHRVAIANSRLIACDRTRVTFRWKDYRADGRDRQKVMTLATGEFIRRFLIHVLPQGFHRIRHYGLFASGTRADNIARARRLLDIAMAQSKTADATTSSEPEPLSHRCPCCGGRMVIIETFERGASPRYRPAASPIVNRIDSS